MFFFYKYIKLPDRYIYGLWYSGDCQGLLVIHFQM